MSDLNSVLLEGKLEHDPDAGTEPNGLPVCRFVVKSRRCFQSKDDIKTEFMSVTVTTFGNLAQKCAENLKKGRGVRVVGRLSMQDDVLGIVAEHIEFKPLLK